MYASEAMARLLYCCLLYTVATVPYSTYMSLLVLVLRGQRPVLLDASSRGRAMARHGMAWYGMACEAMSMSMSLSLEHDMSEKMNRGRGRTLINCSLPSARGRCILAQGLANSKQASKQNQTLL